MMMMEPIRVHEVNGGGDNNGVHDGGDISPIGISSLNVNSPPFLPRSISLHRMPVPTHVDNRKSLLSHHVTNKYSEQGRDEEGQLRHSKYTIEEEEEEEEEDAVHVSAPSSSPPPMVYFSDALLSPSRDSPPRPILKPHETTWLSDSHHVLVGGEVDMHYAETVSRLRALRLSSSGSSDSLLINKENKGRRRHVAFAERVNITETFEMGEASRRPDPYATFLHLDGRLKREIRAELNDFKRNEMPIHHLSIGNTVFH